MRSPIAIAALALSLAAAGPLSAAEAPHPGLVDPRIRSIEYDSDQVVLLTGHLGYQMMIEFAPDERIQNVAIGDGLNWQVTPNKAANLLFLKPMSLSKPTDMTVVTNLRRYSFELRSRSAAREPPSAITYVVEFIYPPDNSPVAVVATAPPPQPPERKNVAYTYTGSRAALPSEVFDDGRFTYFRWPESLSTPALFVVEPDGSESIANSTMRDGYQVVEQLARRFVLRNGKEVTQIINDAWRDPTPGPLAPRPHDSRTAQAASRAEKAHD
jgi:type IV secretion system protein VirB9